MNIQIITSSYPSFPGDPTASAGLFVNAFALELRDLGHRVVVQPVARKKAYTPDPGIGLEPIPWSGGDVVLAEMNYWNPLSFLRILDFFYKGRTHCLEVHERYKIDRVLCMWAVPCGLFGFWIKKKLHKPYDVWALGSDIWKIKKIPLMGPAMIRTVIREAEHIFADGMELCAEVERITQRQCPFLPSCRKLPRPNAVPAALKNKDKCHLLFVGRYYQNKGPDLLLRALHALPDATKQKLQAHVFGFGEMKEELMATCRELNLGGMATINDGIEPQDFVNYLKEADFLVIPSRIESIPVVFSDAMQLQLPVISMPVGDLPGLIKEYHCGVVAEEVSHTALAKAIETACSAGKNHFMQNTIKASQKFDIAAIVRQWLDGPKVKERS